MSTLPPRGGLAERLQALRLRGLIARSSRAAFTRSAALTKASLLLILLGCLLVVLLAANRPSFLSATTRAHFFPGWIAGPLGRSMPWLTPSDRSLESFFTVVVIVTYASYLFGADRIGQLRARWVIGAIVAVQVVFLLSPPLTLTDVFNYINYARMEFVHNLDPYATIPALEPHRDPAFALSNWHNLLSPYGPLFTILMFTVVPWGVAASFWLVKVSLALCSLACLGLVWRCAELLHRDPRKAVFYAGLNPIALLWGLGGDHNDLAMMFFILLALYLLLRAGPLPVRSERMAGARPRLCARDLAPSRLCKALPGLLSAPLWLEIAAGASLAAAVFVKASAGIVVPVIVAGLARAPRRAVQTVLGGVIGAVVFGLVSYMVFGAHLPGIGTQGSIVTDLSMPNLLGLALGQGGETATLRMVLLLALMLAVVGCCVFAWRTGDFISGSGWASIALLVTLAWVLPWYIVWVLPMAALSRSRALRIATVAMCVYLIVVWVPSSSLLWKAIGFEPQQTNVGQINHHYVDELLH